MKEEEDSLDTNTQTPKKRKRLDLDYKRILREFRKFYQDEFNSETGFMKKKSTRRGSHFYLKCIAKY